MKFSDFLKEKKFSLALPVFLLLVTLVAGFFLVRFLEGVGSGYLREQSEVVVEAMTTGVQNELQSAESAAGAMAGSPWIFPALLDPDPANIENANSVLDRYKKNLGFSICYLLDPRGETIASSNRNDPGSFVGKNYSFRPYFQEAIRGKPSVYMAAGTTSLERGFYAASPVKDTQGKIVGVVAIKKNIDAMRRVLAGSPNTFFVSPDGVVFLSGSRDTVLKPLWPLSSEQVRALNDSKQFNMASFEPVLLRHVQNGEKIRYKGDLFQVFQGPLGPPGWSLVLLTSLKSVFYFAYFGWIITAFVMGIILILMLWSSLEIKRQAVLRESQARFEAAFESSGIGMGLVHLEGRWLKVNPALCRMVGYSIEELMGKTYQDLTHPEDLEKDAALVRRLLKGEIDNYLLEKRYLHRSGRIIWILLAVSLVRDSRGKPLYFMSQVEDISERKQAETELRKFQQAIEQSSATVVITDLTGAITYVNPKFTETTGFTPEEALGQNPRILKSGELPDEVYKELWEAIISGREWQGEFHNRKKNGELYWEHASISPVRDAQGAVTHFLAVKEDITKRKQIEKALGESEKKFRSLVANIPGIVYRCKHDPDWTMLYLSEEVERISGYPATDFINNSVRSYESLIFREDAAFVRQSIEEAVALGKHWEIEYCVIHKDGHVRWVYEKGRGVTDEAGAVQYLDGFILDISDRKRAEETIVGKTKELELQSWGLQKANDGIKVLYQELEKKNADLAKLNGLKDDFVSIVAHELRNPLGVVREAAALVLDGLVGSVSEDQRKYIEIIKKTGDRLIHITTDLLDLAKIEAGKIVVNYEPMDLLSLVRQACEGVSLRANKKGLTITQDFPSAKLEIAGDFDKLMQVMNNLLSNAFKFTEKGGITVEVRELGEEIRCAVKDTGLGISKENLARLFSKFEQFGKSAVSAEKGSGLGLVISKSIVEAHGGRIWAESELGQGTALIFTLPKQHRQKKLGEILVEEKTLSPEQLDEALRKQSGRKA